MNAAVEAAPAARVGVIDIGSNSIRLVIFDSLCRTPLPIINHKIVIGLGVDVERHGRFGQEAFRGGIEAVDVLVRLADSVPCADLALYATAAVRHAANGSDFCRSVEACTGRAVTVLTGAGEARLSAAGVISALPGLSGVIGDLGGGSLELVAVEDGIIREEATRDIGPLRLKEHWGGDPATASAAIREAVCSVTWLHAWKHLSFHAVGGSWRAIARLHMAQNRHPLTIVHGYAMAPSEARTFTRMLAKLSNQTTSRIRGISGRRAAILPWGAMVLDHLMDALEPRDVVFSAQGLREGHHFRMLDPTTRKEDPLLAACHQIAFRHRRFADCSEALGRWIGPVIRLRKQFDTRLVRAACIIADTGWREHPEYRARYSLSRILHMPWSVLDHRERAWLALALFVRYGGPETAEEATPCRRLLKPDTIEGAVLLGRLLRLALVLSAGRGPILDSSPLVTTADGFTLVITRDAAVASPERIERLAAAIGQALDVSFTVSRQVPDRSPAAATAAR